MRSVTGTVQKLASGAADGGDSGANPKRHLASDAVFGFGTPRAASPSNVSMLGLVLASKRLKPVSRPNTRRGPAVAQGHDGEGNGDD